MKTSVRSREHTAASGLAMPLKQTNIKTRALGQPVPLLDETSARIQDLFHHLPSACFAFDQQGLIHAWNAACEALFLLTPAQVIGKPVTCILSPAGPNAMPIEHFAKRALAGERLEQIPVCAKRRHGGGIQFLCYALPVERAGGIIDGAICVCIDIADRASASGAVGYEAGFEDASSDTDPSDIAVINLILQEEVRERKEAEDNLRRLTDGARCLFWNAIVLEENGNRLTWYANMHDEEAAQRFLPLDTASYRHYSEAFYHSRVEEDRRDCDLRSETAIRQGQGYNQEFRCRRRDGQIRWLAEDVVVEPIAPGRWRATGVCMDITERKALETQLSHAQKLESIGHLAAGVAHEINTPIQYIGDNIRFLKEAFAGLVKLVGIYQGLLQTEECENAGSLREKCLAAAQDADLEYLVNEIPCSIAQSLEGVGRVGAIVRAMKEFSHPGFSEKAPADLNHAIESTLTVARNEWKYVANVVTDFDPELPAVRCLPGDLNQVFLNLIVNSAQAIREKIGDNPEVKGTINIQTRQAGEWVEIRFQDSGAGIPETIHAKVFDPFFTTKEVGRGTGQGLSISRMVVVDKHQGTISFESEPNAGTTFIIRLPIVPPVEAEVKKAV